MVDFKSHQVVSNPSIELSSFINEGTKKPLVTSN